MVPLGNTVHAGVAMVSGWVAGAGNIILGSGVFSRNVLLAEPE